MSPLKIAISAFVVGLIGLTASATKDAESSSIPSSEYVPRPLEESLEMQDVEAVLGPGPELQNYKMNLKHYNTHRGPESSSTERSNTTKPIPFLPYVINEISKVENQVIEKKRLQEELQRLQEENQRLQEENQRLQEEKRQGEKIQENVLYRQHQKILANTEQLEEWKKYMAEAWQSQWDEQSGRQRQIDAEHGEGTPIHSNPTLPGGGDPSTTGDHNLPS